MIININHRFANCGKLATKFDKISQSSARRKAEKVEKQLSKVVFDLRYYGMEPLPFTDMFEMTVDYSPRSVDTKSSDEDVYFIGVTLVPRCDHEIAKFCAKLLADGDRGGLKNRIPRWQLACNNIFEDVVDSINSFLKFLIIQLYPKRFYVKGLSAAIGICGMWCNETKGYELYGHVTPRTVSYIMDFANKSAKDNSLAEAALPEYEKYVINELALAATANPDKIDLETPSADVITFTPWFNQYLKVREYEKLRNECASVIDKINVRVSELQEARKVTLENQKGNNEKP